MVFRGHKTRSGRKGCHEAYFQSHTAAAGDDEWESLQMQASVFSKRQIWMMAGPQTKNYSNNNATIKTSVSVLYFFLHSHKSVCRHQYVLHLHLQSHRHPETGLTTICCWGDDELHYLPRWSESAGICPRGVRNIQLPSIREEPVKRLFPLQMVAQNPHVCNQAKAGQLSHFYV